MFADSYPMREIQDGFFYEVDGKVRMQPSEWIVSSRTQRCSQNCHKFFLCSFQGPVSGNFRAVTINIMLMVSALLVLPHTHSSLTLHLLQWTTVGDVDIDIGANPSAEEAEEGVESNERKTVDIIESFRLNVSPTALPVTNSDGVFSLLSISRATWKRFLS